MTIKFKHRIKALSLFANVGVAESHLRDVGVDVVLANELIEKRYNALSEKEKAAYARHQAKIKAMFEKQKKQSDKDESTRS